MKALLLYLVITLPQLSYSPTERYSEKNDRDKLVKTATKLLNTNYKATGNDPSGFDCSGFTQYVYSKAIGVKLEHGSKLQAKKGKNVKYKKAKKGDLIFFHRANRINHVGLITKISGDEIWVIHATSSKGVILEDINKSSYWKTKFAFIRTYL